MEELVARVLPRARGTQADRRSCSRSTSASRAYSARERSTLTRDAFRSSAEGSGGAPVRAIPARLAARGAGVARARGARRARDRVGERRGRRHVGRASDPVPAAAIEIANEPDRAERLRSTMRARRARRARARADQASSGFSASGTSSSRWRSPPDLQRDLRGADAAYRSSALAAECEQFLRDTQAMWDDTLSVRS